MHRPPPSLDDLLAQGPVALFLDFDGTLVDIAPTPEGIAVPADLAARLEALGEPLDGRLALVSGRAVDDLVGHLGSPAIVMAGSHGADLRRRDGSPLGEPPAALGESVDRALQAIVEDHPGTRLEDKPHGAAVHYRAAPDHGPAITQAIDALAADHALIVKHGKCVVELVASTANKGSAVAELMRLPPFANATPVFIGDDITDEDGFRAAIDLGGYGILVGTRDDSCASHNLAGVDEVHDWLALGIR